MGREKVREKILELSRNYRRIWYLRCRNWEHDPEDILLRELDDSMYLKKLWQLPGVNLYMFSKNGVDAGSSLLQD